MRGQLPVTVVSLYTQPGTPARHMEGDRPVLSLSRSGNHGWARASGRRPPASSAEPVC